MDTGWVIGGSLWANEASTNDPFCEPIGWKSFFTLQQEAAQPWELLYEQQHHQKAPLSLKPRNPGAGPGTWISSHRKWRSITSATHRRLTRCKHLPSGDGSHYVGLYLYVCTEFGLDLELVGQIIFPLQRAGWDGCIWSAVTFSLTASLYGSPL